ncbi:MAG TPA: phosphoserine phosphatase SerB [Stellaceae bacterium]|nr:phosphoserine phosphatase SerB [Stellaceae bacterium]
MPDAVLTLIAAPVTGDAAAVSLGDVVAALRETLLALGARLGEVDWLAADRACDIYYDGLDTDQADAGARHLMATAFPDLAADIVVQPSAGRRKALLVADMESTVIENEMLDELADFLGLRDDISEITRQAMNGEIDFAAALTARVALLAGMEATRLAEAARRIRITPGAAALVATMRAHGAYAALVSGGFTVFTTPVRQVLGFDAVIANELIVEDGRLTGTVRDPIVTRETKLAALKSLAAERALPLAASLAVGDGANDLPMIEAAGLGVAFRAKPAVAARARIRIDRGDLTALLYAQGYRASEIVVP